MAAPPESLTFFTCVIVLICKPRARGRFPDSSHLFAGLVDALELLKSVADEYEHVGYADLLQLASVTGIQVRPAAMSFHKPGRVQHLLPLCN